MKKETVLILAKSYSWLGLASMLYLMAIETDGDYYGYLGSAVKFVMYLFFLSDLNNWRIFVLASSFISILFSFVDFNLFSLGDIVGLSFVFWYALKFRK